MDVVTLIQGDEDSPLTPFFLIHAISGAALPFLRLHELSEGGQRPIYGITSPIHCWPYPNPSKLPTSLAGLAEEYIDVIQEFQPPGHPYLLGGWSMGGQIAMFMGQILEARGEAVDKVIMIDSANPEIFPGFQSAEEHKAFSKATYERTVAAGLQAEAEIPLSPVPTPAAPYFSFKDVCPPRYDTWHLGRSSSFPSEMSSEASSSAASLFDETESPLSSCPGTPLSLFCHSDVDSDCETIKEEFDADTDEEPFALKDFLRQTRLHIHRGLNLISNVREGDLFEPAGAKTKFDAVLVKCKAEMGDPDWNIQVTDLEKVRFIQQVMREDNMRWDPTRFRSFKSVPFSAEHDCSFQPEFVEELSEILRDCLEGRA